MSLHCNVYVMVYQDNYNASLIPFFHNENGNVQNLNQPFPNFD